MPGNGRATRSARRGGLNYTNGPVESGPPFPEGPPQIVRRSVLHILRILRECRPLRKSFLPPNVREQDYSLDIGGPCAIVSVLAKAVGKFAHIAPGDRGCPGVGVDWHTPRLPPPPISMNNQPGEQISSSVHRAAAKIGRLCGHSARMPVCVDISVQRRSLLPMRGKNPGAYGGRVLPTQDFAT